MRFFEEWQEGDRVELGTVEFPAGDIIRFGRAYDPQYFHVDPEAARHSLLGGLCASGWQTCGMFMRLFVEWSGALRAERAARGETSAGIGPSPGLDDIAWPKPVYAGDRVTYVMEAVETRPLASRPGWGLVRLRAEGFNQHGDKVLSLIDNVFVERRPGS